MKLELVFKRSRRPDFPFIPTTRMTFHGAVTSGVCKKYLSSGTSKVNNFKVGRGGGEVAVLHGTPKERKTKLQSRLAKRWTDGKMIAIV